MSNAIYGKKTWKTRETELIQTCKQQKRLFEMTIQ